jgi:predicted transcriptional regulator YdeE
MHTISMLATLLLLSIFLAAESSAPRVVHQQTFSVMGIEVRTTNAKEASSEGVIGRQWQKFFQEGVLQKIPNRADSNLYAVYRNYASDRNGEYSVLIGAKVPEGSVPPTGLVLKTVPAGNYAVVTSEQGPVVKVVVAAWQRVWKMEDEHTLGGRRAYAADFELYDQRGMDPQNSQVDLYIGLK